MKSQLRLYVAGLLLFTYIGSVKGQILPQRFTKPLFTTSTQTTVTFSTAVPQPRNSFSFCSALAGLPINVNENDTVDINLQMDILTPVGDTMMMRPAVIIGFGGGFVQGDRSDAGMRKIADSLVARGFVAALIDYRLGMKVNDEEISKRAVYRGIQDGRSAVRYLRAHAQDPTLRIDPEQIYIGGHSSGGFIGLHNLYLDKDSERPASTRDFSGLKDQLCLDCVGDNTDENGKANAGFGLAAAIGELMYLESAADRPVIMFHDDKDGTVFHEAAKPFGVFFDIFCGNLPIVYGSKLIAQRAAMLGITHEYYETQGRGHDVHIDGNGNLYPEIIPLMSDFFFRNLLKPDVQIDGSLAVCEGSPLASYTASSDARYYEWSVIGGNITSGGNQLESSITVDWDPLSPTHSISCIPYSIHGARGDQETIEINVVGPGTNTYLQTSTQWSDLSNWDRGHVPLPCDDVVVPASLTPLTLIIEENLEVKIRSLVAENGTEIIVKSNAQIHISEDGSF